MLIISFYRFLMHVETVAWKERTITLRSAILMENATQPQGLLHFVNRRREGPRNECDLALVSLGIPAPSLFCTEGSCIVCVIHVSVIVVCYLRVWPLNIMSVWYCVEYEIFRIRIELCGLSLYRIDVANYYTQQSSIKV